MSFAPPPNDAPPPGSGGGFGPPQGFGPPPPPGGGYEQQPPVPGGYGGYGGYGPPAAGPGAGAPGGYGPPPAGPGALGGYSPPPPPGGYGMPHPGTPNPGPGMSAPGGWGPYPPPPKRGNGARIAGVVVALVIAAAIVIGGIIWLGSGYDHQGNPQAKGGAPKSSASPSPDDGGAPSGGSPGSAASGAPAPTAPYSPYVKLPAGACFDSPGLDADVFAVTKIPCTTPHDGEVVADVRLTGTFADEADLQSQALALCKPHAQSRLKSIPDDGKMYYNYALYPNLTTYETKGENTVSCALTLSNHQGGALLTAPLP